MSSRLSSEGRLALPTWEGRLGLERSESLLELGDLGRDVESVVLVELEGGESFVESGGEEGEVGFRVDEGWNSEGREFGRESEDSIVDFESGCEVRGVGDVVT